MEFTLKQIVESQDALQRLMDNKMPAVTAYKIQRIIRKILVEAELFREARDKLVRQYGTEVSGKPGNFVVQPENMQVYAAEIMDILSQKIDMDIRLLHLSDFNGVDISVRDMLLLDYLIQEDENEPGT